MRDLVLAAWLASSAAWLLAGAAGGAEPFATDTPTATVATLHEGLVDVAARTGGAGVDERYAQLEPLIEATHDLPYIAEFALRRQWSSLGAADRERFVAAFERLSIMTYASRFAAVDDGSFKIVESRDLQPGRAEVVAAIVRPDGTEVSLEYVLEQRGDAWRIINIVADGVSDLALKRAEYQRVLADGTLDDLVAELEAQTQRLQ
jgi:phospholipid transport system substrate-binding protein